MNECMQRRLFFKNITIPLIGALFKPGTTGDPKPKVCVVGIGSSGCKIAAEVFKALPYRVNYHAIDSSNNYGEKHRDLVTCWYATKLQSNTCNRVNCLKNI